MNFTKQQTIPKDQTAGRYAAARSSLNTYDIINCEHKDWFWRMIGHTATVYKDYMTGQVSVYESTTLNKFNGFSGVQLTPMRLWLYNYPGKVFVRRMIIEDPKIEPKFRQNIMAEAHIEKFRGVPYPDLSDPKQRKFVFNAALDMPFGIGANPDRHDIMFCTQLVADFWQDGGLYIGDEPPAEFEPDDMREGGEFERQLVEGVVLNREMRLK